MSDEDKMAQNAAESPTPEVTPSSENEQQETVKEPQEATPTENTPESDPEIEVEEKRTRLEKRLNQLLEKSKEARKQLGSSPENSEKTQEIAQDVLNDPAQLKDIVNEYGEVDVYKLLDKVNQIADARVAKALSTRDQQTHYQKRVNDWYEDAEHTLRQIHQDFGEDPDLVESLNQRMGKLVERMNLDNGQFNPKVKSSELYNDLKETIVKARTFGQSKASANLADIADTGALKPKSPNNAPKNDLDSLRQRMIKDPTSVRKELEKRLPRAQD